MKTIANRLIGALLLGLIIVLSSSCSSSYEPPTSYEAPEDLPNQSAGQYPAEIFGKVIVAEKLQKSTAIPVAPSDESRVYWLQEITINNVSYPDPIEAYISGGGGWTKWRLVYNDKEYNWIHIPGDIHIDRGGTATFWTYCTMPRYLEISDVQIRYTGQEPYSYGDLTLIDEVEAYDWSTKKSITEGTTEETEKEDAIPDKAIVIDDWQIQLISSVWSGSTLNVNLKITNQGDRRNFGFPSFSTPGQPELAVFDSTGKKIDPWVREPDLNKGELIIFPPYAKEYYPNESWSGTIRFDMSPYSGETILYIGRYSWTQKVPLFELGSP